MPFAITGNTYAHRELLKSFHARWNGETKRWEADHLTDLQQMKLRALVGVSLGTFEHVPPPAIDWDDETAELIEAVSQLPDGKKRKLYNRKSNLYGDEATYHNHFADQNPIAYFGFSSLGKFVAYLDGLPSVAKRGPGYKSGGEAFAGTASMSEALTLAREGWQEGAELAEWFAERLAVERPPQKRRKASVAGGRVSVGRLLAGNPAHMINRPKQPGTKTFTFFVEAGCSAAIKAETMLIRAAAIAALCDLMENNGYSCTIVAVDTAVWMQSAVYQLAVTLKEAGERLNLSDVAFALGHPSFLRRLSFGATTSVPETHEIWRSMGSPSNAFDSAFPHAKNEFYVPVFTAGNQRAILDDPFSIMRHITPKNLPIEV